MFIPWQCCLVDSKQVASQKLCASFPHLSDVHIEFRYKCPHWIHILTSSFGGHTPTISPRQYLLIWFPVTIMVNIKCCVAHGIWNPLQHDIHDPLEYHWSKSYPKGQTGVTTLMVTSLWDSSHRMIACLWHIYLYNLFSTASMTLMSLISSFPGKIWKGSHWYIVDRNMNPNAGAMRPRFLTPTT